jgi:hypothetical protein
MATHVSIATIKARALLTETVELLPAEKLSLINPLIYSNAAKLDDAAFRRWIHWFNAARDIEQPPVLLGHYRAPAYLDGTGPFAVLTGDALVEEQAAPDKVDLATTWFNLQQRLPDAHELDRPCLLACRYGEWTWGHWLIDMLPKIVLAERFTPKRFTYVVPGNITQPAAAQFYIRAVLDSLAIYGIEPSRLLRVQPGQAYRFQNLYDIADISSDGMHPGVLAAMRNTPTVPAGPRLPFTAVLRAGAEHRPIANGAAIEAVLRDHGAAIVNPGAIPFAEQIRIFRDSETIAGDLGSNLAAAIYARPEAGILTLAPSGWYDGFHANIFRRLGALQADVRGVSSPTGEDAGHAPHTVNPDHVVQGLAAIRAAKTNYPGAPNVAGRIIARAPGRIVWQIRFGEGGDAAQFQRGLFSAPEGRFTWSMGPSCRVIVPGFMAPATDLWLEVKGVGFTARPHLVSRTLGVAVNGTMIATYDIDELTHIYVPVPAALLAARRDLELEFLHPMCPSPLSMGISADTRPLGFQFETLSLRLA